MDGTIPNPDAIDIRVDYLGQIDPEDPSRYLPGEEPRANFIPDNASVTVLFQGANPIADGSKEIDPVEVTDWYPSPEMLGFRWLWFQCLCWC